jgi:DNA repair photolyase
MKIKEITSKIALSTSRLPGLTYALNPYIGCIHQCQYCYSPGILHLQNSEWENMVQVKRNLPLVLSKELKQKKPGTIGLSTVTDPYQPIEKTYQITRYCLEVLSRKNFPICIQTKSDLILRDKVLIKKCSNVEVMVSIGTLNDAHRKLLEPGSSSISNRLSILRSFSNSDIKTSVFFGPIYPTVTTEEIPEILERFLECGIDEIMIDCLHPKQNIKSSLYRILQDKPEFYEWMISLQTNDQQESFSDIRKCIYDYLKNKDVIIKDAF